MVWGLKSTTFLVPSDTWTRKLFALDEKCCASARADEVEGVGVRAGEVRVSRAVAFPEAACGSMGGSAMGKWGLLVETEVRRRWSLRSYID